MKTPHRPTFPLPAQWDRLIATLSTLGLTALLGLQLAGCGIFAPDPAGNHLGWYRAAAPLPLGAWIKVSPGQIHEQCERGRDWNGQACMFRTNSHCVVISTYTEEQARRVQAHDGLTLWQHEVDANDGRRGHCAGFDHREQSVWSMTAAQGVVR